MPETTTATVLISPWNNPQFFTEAGLHDAQEYFFRTHAKNSQRVAEGRNATGLAKTFQRNKLNKEMGEDFKMYTGINIGGKENEERRGIREEFNQILLGIYRGIAPGQTPNSRTTEDLVILKHPLGALEVAFNFSCFHTVLKNRYYSLVGNKRMLLTQIIDEELFKWVWRMFYSLMHLPGMQLPDFRNGLTSVGLSFLSAEKRGLSSLGKLIDVGFFLLSASVSNSHLRYLFCLYYVNYLRQLQYRALDASDRRSLEATFSALSKRKQDAPIENVLTAVDFLMNSKGNSQQAFDDVLGNEEAQAPQHVPKVELEFIDNYQEFTKSSLPHSIAKYLSRSQIAQGQSASMIPLLFVLRTSPYAVREQIFQALPGPFLSMVRNRLSYGAADPVNKGLVDSMNLHIKERQGRGESYTIVNAPRKTRIFSQQPSSAAGDKPSDTVAALSPPQKQPAAQTPYLNQAALMTQRLIVTWEVQNGALQVVSISAEEITDLLGSDGYFLAIWVLFAIKSGQLIQLPPQTSATKEVLEKIINVMLKGWNNPRKGQLSPEERGVLLAESQNQSPQWVLLNLIRKYPIGKSHPLQAGSLSPAISSLVRKMGKYLPDFLNNPRQKAYKAWVQELSKEEKKATNVLYKVKRM